MKRKKFIAIIVFCLIAMTGFLAAEVKASFPDILKPTFIAVDDQNLYINEKASIFVYSLKDFSLKTKFGISGEGPKEFKISPGGEGIMIFPQPENLAINSVGKVSLFTREGQFIKEFMSPGGPMAQMVQPIGKNYIALMRSMDNSTQSMSMAVNLYDEKLNKIKEIFKMPIMKGGKMTFPMTAPTAFVDGNRMVCAGKVDAFSLLVYDEQGNQVAEITRDYKLLSVTKEYQNKIHELFKTMPDTKQYYDLFKNMLSFGDKFPPIQQFWVADGNVYIQTYKEKDGIEEFFVYSNSGKFIKQVQLPVHYMYGVRISPTAFKNNTFYQLIENDDEEIWQLHAHKVLPGNVE